MERTAKSVSLVWLIADRSRRYLYEFEFRERALTAGNANSSGKEDAQQDHNIRDGIPKVVSLYEAQKFKGSIDFVVS